MVKKRMETEGKLIELVRNSERLTRDTLPVLRQLVERYPYYQTARLLLLENLYQLHDPEYNDELRRSAVLLADRAALFNAVEGKHYEISPETLPTDETTADEGADRTMSLIESFLTDLPVETSHRKPVTADAAQDYAAYLMQLDEQERQKEEEPVKEVLEEDFVTSPKKKRTRRKPLLSEPVDMETTEPDAQDDEDERPSEAFFTETLAQIYIKQQKYERALEIIRALYLKNPKKNGYFADQIRFLEKLILINKSKKQ